MSTKEIEIHGEKVKYDDESHLAKRGIKYLDKIDKEKAKVFFDAARRHPDRISHFEVHDQEGDKEHDVTLVHDGEGHFTLRKRSNH